MEILIAIVVVVVLVVGYCAIVSPLKDKEDKE